jgi:hypothetical protein
MRIDRASWRVADHLRRLSMNRFDCRDTVGARTLVYGKSSWSQASELLRPPERLVHDPAVAYLSPRSSGSHAIAFARRLFFGRAGTAPLHPDKTRKSEARSQSHALRRIPARRHDEEGRARKIGSLVFVSPYSGTAGVEFLRFLCGCSPHHGDAFGFSDAMGSLERTMARSSRSRREWIASVVGHHEVKI